MACELLTSRAERYHVHTQAQAGSDGSVLPSLGSKHLEASVRFHTWPLALPWCCLQRVGRCLGKQREYRIDLYFCNKLVTYDSKTTLYRAAVASPETARHARSCGLRIHTNYSLQVTAGLHADVQTLVALRKLGMLLNYTVMDAVALSGRLNILQSILSEQQCPAPDELPQYAARSGNVSMLKWLNADTCCKFDEFACEGAAKEGKLAALQYLRSEGCEWNENDVVQHAARSGSIAMVEWLWRHSDADNIDTVVMIAAATDGSIAMCERLRDIGFIWTVDALTGAATSGNFKTLRWLRDNGCPWDMPTVFQQAAKRGCTDMLDFILEQGEVLSAELLGGALRDARWGNKQTIQWLKQHGAQ
jgi:hypothetical protein